jgi:tetraacyldisaccharide 4'-kinase
MYGLVAQLRMWAFDWGIFKTSSFDQKIISIGNIKVGGTGKTPLTLYIARLFNDTHTIALLSRGYGRKTKGFKMVLKNDAVALVGDEVYMMRQSLPDSIPIAVAESRVEGANELIKNYPNLEVIVLDDAYQHRYINRNCNVLITEYNDLFSNDFYLPTGSLREWRTGAKRASMVVVSKCPSIINRQQIEKSLRPYLKNNTPVFYSNIVYGNAINRQQEVSFFTLKTSSIIVTGIANALPFINHLKSLTHVVKHFEYNDHFDYSLETIQIIESFANDHNIETLITTEKDWVKIKTLIKASKFNWVYVPIEIHLNGEESLFKETILRTFVS